MKLFPTREGVIIQKILANCSSLTLRTGCEANWGRLILTTLFLVTKPQNEILRTIC
jgi:hypothetical protein